MLVAALAVLGLQPVVAQAAVIVNERSPATGAAHNPCTGEIVFFDRGTSHLVISTTEDGAGGIHFHDHVDFSGVRGTGETTGDEYVVTYSGAFNQNATGASTTTSGQTFHMIRVGSQDDYLLHADAHFTITPDGDVTAEVIHLRISCQG